MYSRVLATKIMRNDRDWIMKNKGEIWFTRQTWGFKQPKYRDWTWFNHERWDGKDQILQEDLWGWRFWFIIDAVKLRNPFWRLAVNFWRRRPHLVSWFAVLFPKKIKTITYNLGLKFRDGMYLIRRRFVLLGPLHHDQQSQPPARLDSWKCNAAVNWKCWENRPSVHRDLPSQTWSFYAFWPSKIRIWMV